MKALLLCAGMGSRLKPITDLVPKPLVPINGKPLLQYWLENLSNAGVSEFMINISYLSQQFVEFVQKSEFKDSITLLYEKELLNTGGTVLANREFFGRQPFLLIHADNLSFCNFKAFLRSHKERPCHCVITMMLFKTTMPSQCGVVTLSENGIVNEFYEKVDNPPTNLANGAVYILEPAIIDFLISLNKKVIDFSCEVIPKFLGRINTYLNDIYHRDIGTIESYAMSQVEILKFLDH